MDGLTLSAQVPEVPGATVVAEVPGAAVVVELVELTWSQDLHVNGQVFFIAGPAVASLHAALIEGQTSIVSSQF